MTEASTRVIAPCEGGCGETIEDEGPMGDDWYCSSCWPGEKLRRVTAERDELSIAWQRASGAFVDAGGLVPDEPGDMEKCIQSLAAEIARLRLCSTCCGTPHASGLTCICGGTGRAEDEVRGLRLAALRNAAPALLDVAEAAIRWRCAVDDAGEHDKALDALVVAVDKFRGAT